MEGNGHDDKQRSRPSSSHNHDAARFDAVKTLVTEVFEGLTVSSSALRDLLVDAGELLHDMRRAGQHDVKLFADLKRIPDGWVEAFARLILAQMGRAS